MDAIIIAVDPGVEGAFLARIPLELVSGEAVGPVWGFSLNESTARMEKDLEPMEGYLDAIELEYLRFGLQDPAYYLLWCRDVAFCNMILMSMVDGDGVRVFDGSDIILSGCALAAILRQAPRLNWMSDPE